MASGHTQNCTAHLRTLDDAITALSDGAPKTTMRTAMNALIVELANLGWTLRRGGAAKGYELNDL